MTVMLEYNFGTLSVAGCTAFAGVVVNGERVVALEAFNVLPLVGTVASILTDVGSDRVSSSPHQRT